MPKTLILTASTGSGHNRAADSLKNELEVCGYHVRIVEPFKEEGRGMDLLVENGFQILATRLPKMYGRLYRITDHKLVTKGVAGFVNLTLSRTVFSLIREYQPDLLISTHPLLVNVISFLKALHKTNLPFISVVTDYMAHQCYVNKYVDAYIVASQYTKNTLMAKGIQESRIFTYGIPIGREFRQPRQNKKKKDSVFTMLLMAGGMGISLIKDCLEILLQNQHDFRIAVVCGNNRKLKDELEEKYALPIPGKQITIYGFTTEIPRLMDESDLVITKPGGLTISEAINKNIPILIPFYIPGQEEENTEIMVNAGVAASISDLSELNVMIDNFCENPELLENMRLKAREFSKEFSPGSIVQLADRLVYGKLTNAAEHKTG